MKVALPPGGRFDRRMRGRVDGPAEWNACVNETLEWTEGWCGRNAGVDGTLECRTSTGQRGMRFVTCVRVGESPVVESGRWRRRAVGRSRSGAGDACVRDDRVSPPKQGNPNVVDPG